MARVTEIKHARVLRDLVASLERGGWNVHHSLVSPDGLDGPTVYLYDAETRCRQSIIYPNGALKLIAQQSDLLKATFEDKCIFLDGLIGELSSPNSEFPLREVHTLLKIAAGAYLLDTQIYKISRIDGGSLQYLIVRSLHMNGEAHLLWPSRVMTETRLAPEELEQCALNLLTGHAQRAKQLAGAQDATFPAQDCSGSSSGAALSRSAPFVKPRPSR
jgi:hypothetical protein